MRLTKTRLTLALIAAVTIVLLASYATRGGAEHSADYVDGHATVASEHEWDPGDSSVVEGVPTPLQPARAREEVASLRQYRLHILGEDGSVLDGASVHVGDARVGAQWAIDTKSDPDGIAFIELDAGTEASVAVNYDGALTGYGQVQQLQRFAETPDLLVTVPRASSSLVVRVRDDRGVPVAGVDVFVDGPRKAAREGRYVTEQDGQVALEGVVSGEWYARIDRLPNGYEVGESVTASCTVAGSDLAYVDLMVRRWGVLLIDCTSLPDRLGDVSVITHPRTSSVLSSVPRDVVALSAPAGRYRVGVELSGDSPYAAVFSDVSVQAGEDSRVPLQVIATSIALSGRTVDEYGVPVPNVAMSWSWLDGESVVRLGVVSGSRGEWSLDAVAGLATVSFDAVRTYARRRVEELWIDGDRAQVDFVVPRAHKVLINPPIGNAVECQVRLRSRSVLHSYASRYDAQEACGPTDSARFERLPAGEYELLLRHDGQEWLSDMVFFVSSAGELSVGDSATGFTLDLF